MNESMLSADNPMFDADGFLVEPDKWSVTLANSLAQAEGLGALTPDQLELLHNLRAEFESTGAVTAHSHVCHLGGQEPDCMQHLFPSPLHAWRVAGLPNPGEEAKAYMSKN